MATQLLATGTGAADSSDLVVTSGSSITVGLKGMTLQAEVRIDLKDDQGNYNPAGMALSYATPATSITAAGTYRFSRVNGTCGVFSA